MRMSRGACLLLLLLSGCVTGGGEDSPAGGDASVTSDSAAPKRCDPMADPCPPDQHCSPLLRECIAGCRSDAGCSKGKCDVMNHECVGCLANSDCPTGEVCSANNCVLGCTPERPCPGALSCCSGACVDTATNADNCGSCGNKCVVTNGSAACASGKCAIASCKAPFENCDTQFVTGCETDTTSSTAHCGACGKKCEPAHGTGTCALGVCKVASCATGFADCNMTATDGCEADLARDPSNCGSCGNKPTEVCNLKDDNCNGACDDVDGCRVGIHRSFGSEYFYTNSSTEAACCGFTVEALNYYYLYSSGGADRTAFYRCYNPTVGRHFYTTSSTCEIWGAGAVESSIGHIATTATCGAVPLYRLYHGSYGHLFTTEESERASKIGAGWKDEGITGYVWKSPRG